MMNILKHLFSGWLMGVLLLIFASVIGYATFIENDYGSAAARMAVFNAFWFEILLFLMVVNFSGMIFTRRLYTKGMRNVLVIHLSLILIIIGAGVTRYFGSEGMLHIRNGESKSVYQSSDKYLQVHLTKGEKSLYANEKVLLSGASDNIFSKTYENVNVALTGFNANSVLTVKAANEGPGYLSLVVASRNGRNEFSLREGEVKDMKKFGFAFGDTSRADFVTIIKEGEKLRIRFPQELIDLAEFKDTTKNYHEFNSIEVMELRKVGHLTFVIKEYIPHSILEYAPSENSKDGQAVVTVSANGEEFTMPLGQEHVFTVEDAQVSVRVGSIPLQLPFEIKLNDFQLERYPGSNSPSSFVSNVTVIDEKNNLEMPYSIYMNHILNYEGYRFFQSSYDTDEQGTVLSVNHDYWGTLITYLGYTALFASLLATFFMKSSRFKRVSFQLKDVHERRKKFNASMILIFLLAGTVSYAQEVPIDADHAAKFGQLLVQNKDGRIEPLNTMSSKFLVKIHKKDSYNGLSSDQVFLGIMAAKDYWKNEPVIKIGDKEVEEILGINSSYACLNDFITEKGSYKLLSHVEIANQKKPSTRSTFDKALISADERLNVFFMIMNRNVIKIFPLEGDANNRWLLPKQHHKLKGHGNEDAELFDDYFTSLRSAIKTGDYGEANKNVEAISDFQNKYGAAVIPSETSQMLEIFYNKANIFKRLFPYYLTFGVILVALFFIQTFQPKYEFKKLINILFWVLLIAFLIQTFGLILRWYISGHAPWSNGYESMIYISWATMLAGFVFMRKSSITLGVTSSITGIALLTAHMSWLNPEITNLVPVLKSYWLTIHVATITASYGFLALGCMLAFLNLIVIIFRTSGNAERINLTLRELALIVEMSISIGLILLVIGNFLGAIWANESWGRYWGWDPKETWTLVTIILYSFTLHLTLIPSIRSTFTFSFFSFISFGAVLMTYFGVNYYLSGLHSYAGGDSVPIPSFVYYSLIVAIVVSLLAGYRDYAYSNSLNEE